ncbi:MAG TPA: PrsW family glutamic-type intramembrane protease, partial [bacterium]|nr:PrsW family glutamic-type intramembrane protease [bacterium]
MVRTGMAIAPRRSIWIAQPLAIAALLVYVLAVAVLAPVIQGAARPAPWLVGLLLAVLPAALWLVLFYVQDHREPEPLSYVVPVAIGGAVLGAGVAIPIVRSASLSAVLATANPITALAIAILFVGVLQQLCVYLAVRFLVFDQDEFDEVSDGFVYGTAAALGLATTLNLNLVLQSRSIDPLPASLTIVVTALALAASGGVLGYFLGRAKLRGERMAAVTGLLISAVLNGLVAYVLRQVSYAGLSYRPWNGLIVAAVVAGAVTFFLFRRIRTTIAQPEARLGPHSGLARLDLPVWIAVAAALVVGWLLIGTVQARTVGFADPQGTLRLKYPSGWFAVPGSTNLLEVQNPLSGAAVPTVLIVTREARPADRTIDQVVRDGLLSRAQRLAMYRVLREQAIT